MKEKSGTIMKNMFYYRTPIGLIGIAENEMKITNLWFPGEKGPGDAMEKETSLLAEANDQLTEYLSGEREEFKVPLDPSGTPFQRTVWRCLLEIPYGQTRSYGDIARSIGSPLASRAVGMANNRNPISILIPCHRVIGANGKLVGYAGGLNIKKYLLDLEVRKVSTTSRILIGSGKEPE
jgi:methylated-DNA-[protein]-cysteine S-methyltransferase